MTNPVARLVIAAIAMLAAIVIGMILWTPPAAPALYHKQVTSTADSSMVESAAQDIGTYIAAAGEVERVEGLAMVVDNGKVNIVSAKDEDAPALDRVGAIEPKDLYEYGKVRVGQTVYTWISTTALSRGDASTTDLMSRLGVANWTVNEDGFVLDGNGLVVCAATSPVHERGEIIETPAGVGRVYDIAWGLDRVI